MRYRPVNSTEKIYIGKYWNKKFIRAVQAILHATFGKIGRGKSFFDFSFGKDLEEFFKILYMPEHMIKFRNRYKEEINNWWKDFNNLTIEEKAIIKPIIENYNFKDFKTDNSKIRKVLDYYTNSLILTN
jgi:hypothetical protein